MNFTDAERENARHLSDAAVKWLDYVERRPQCLEKKTFSNLGWDKDFFAVSSWPTFIDKDLSDRLTEAARAGMTLSKTVLHRIFKDSPQKMSQYYNLDLPLVRNVLSMISDKYNDTLVARCDLMLGEDNQIKNLENNITANLGGWELQIGMKRLVKHPDVSQFLQENKLQVINRNLLDELIDHVLTMSLTDDAMDFHGEEEINIAVATKTDGDADDWQRPAAYLNRRYSLVNRNRHNERFRGNVSIINFPFPTLSLQDGKLYHNGRRIHAIINYLGMRTPPNLLNCFLQNKLMILNNNVTFLLANKLTLALLSAHEDSDLYSPQERELIKKYIPWTRKVEPGLVTYEGKQYQLEDLLLKHPERFVLKPGLKYGGIDVSCGYATPEPLWRKSVATAMQAREWAVQEFIPPMVYPFQQGESGVATCQMVWGVYLFGNRFAGNMARILDVNANSGVINASKGAEACVVLTVDDLPKQ